MERVPIPGGVREKVSYAVERGDRVHAYLFLPEAPGPHPAVLCVHQHNREFHLGKSEPAGLAGNPEQAYALELARRGYVTLAPDAIGFEERQHPVLRGQDYERFEATKRLTEGSCLQAKMLWDLMRGLDYLTARREVDPRRVGCLGHSLGGQETLFLSAVDRRVAAAVSSCGFSSYQAIFDAAINHNFAAYVPGLLRHGGVGRVLGLAAPRPFLALAGRDDPIFPLAGVRATVRAARGPYARREGSPAAPGLSGGPRLLGRHAGGRLRLVRPLALRWRIVMERGLGNSADHQRFRRRHLHVRLPDLLRPAGSSGSARAPRRSTRRCTAATCRPSSSEGRLSGPEYHRKVMGLFGVDMPYAEFFRMYGDIFTEIPATCDLLRRLRTRYPLYLLSDTNEIHFGYVRQTVDVLQIFEAFIVSYEVGAMKPDPPIYQEAVRRSGIPAEACVFIDDRPGNVEGARRVGMHAVQFHSPEQCAADLARLGVVIP